jgi:hypothetical protein
MNTRFDTCSLCPRLCRAACPVATGASREAAVPTQIAGVLRDWRRGLVDAELARQAATLCVDCGACRALCHLDRPLPEALREARAELVVTPSPDPVGPVEGSSAVVAIETDQRSWAAALSRHLGEPVARLRTRDALGAESLECPSHAGHLERVRRRLGGLQPVVAHGGVAAVLRAAGVPFRWLHEVVGDGGAPSCACGDVEPLACCGAAGPLRRHHPADAERVAELFVARGGGTDPVDSRCAELLRGVDGGTRDAVDRLLGAS